MTKKILKLFLMTIVLFIGITTAKAEEIKNTLVISNYAIGNEPVMFPDSALNSVNFHVKKTSDGKYVYCIHYSKKPPVNSVGYTKSSLVTDKGINYILSGGANAWDDTEFFKYQTALWIYLVETGQMQGTYNDINRFINTIANSDDEISREIRSIVDTAKDAVTENDDYYAQKPTVTINDSNVTFTLKDGYYTSSKINVSSSTGKYEAKLTSAPEGSQITEVTGSYFIVKVPASKVTKTTTIKYEVTNTKSVYTSYYYTPSNSDYQKMAYTYKERHYDSDNGSATITVKEPTIIKIIKVDADTNQPLKDATLKLVNSKGKLIDTWQTDGNAKEFKDLPADTYTITEIDAPIGYEKSNEEITFKIDENGNITNQNGKKIVTIAFTNKKIEKETGVKISKQDITNKQELPGATLVIKDYNGNIVTEFVSKNEPTYFKLKAGTYTLTETIAPEGYILSSETITFTVKEDGTIDTVIMYNTPNSKEVVVENTASFKTITSTVIGLIISVLGFSLIFKKPKKLV